MSIRNSGGQAHLLIGDMARLAACSVATIRFYESKGLLGQPPRHNGRRYYGVEMLADLKLIRDLRNCGLGLGEIQSVLTLRRHPGSTCDDVANTVMQHAANLASKIRLLRLAETRLRGLAAACSENCKATAASDCKAMGLLAGG